MPCGCECGSGILQGGDYTGTKVMRDRAYTSWPAEPGRTKPLFQARLGRRVCLEVVRRDLEDTHGVGHFQHVQTQLTEMDH
jgi:hypothetical protein